MAAVTITVRENGPYRITGPFRLIDTDGNAYELPAGETVALCRCGLLGDEAVLRQDPPRPRLRRAGAGAQVKIRAAVLEEFGAPLEVQEVELAEPKAGEVLVRLVACGVCHTDLYTASGADPSGYAPTVLGHEGAGVVERVGDGVDSLAPGDHVVTLFAPQCRECVHCRSPRHQPLHRDPGGAEQGPPPGRHRPPLARRRADPPLHGHLDLRRVHRDARDRAREGEPGGAARGRRALRLRALDRPRRRDEDRRGRAGSTCVVFGAGMVGLGAVAGCRLQGAERIICVDLSEERLELATGQGATETMLGGPDAVERILEATGGFGADYTFEATGNVGVMRQAVESARMGWGLCTVAGVAGKGETLEIVPRFLITGRRVAGSSFGGIKGRDEVPQLVDRWLAGEIDVDPFLSHSLTLDEVNRGFELMEAQDGIRSVIRFD